MNPEKAPEELLFEQAIKWPAGPERQAFLDQACVNAQALRQRLNALLEAHDNPASAIESSTGAGVLATRRVTFADEEGAGTIIGPYKILEKLGEGGFGVVYVAEQRAPVQRRVALKVIKMGMDTRQVIARFEAERQALAMMDHPNIAKVLDAGATTTGRPYFVMELVRGIKLTEYCDQNKLTTRERLDLFNKVCQAIQHAHQKGIIHRDIKPSNILVTLHDGVPVPKVIDFGIAKATEGRLTELTVYTELHQFIGTPAYTSPEQAEMSGLDIDTRSDIYSLGVLLYELLTGCTPFDGKELVASGLDAMRKTICEKDPQRPSNKLNTLSGDELNTAAQRRGIDPSKLINLLSVDLDWIIMKCLEKDRARRYETADGLAADLERFMSDEPVVARPPSTAYRLQKTFRRNKLAFTAATAVATVVVLGGAVSAWQALRATRAEHEQARLRRNETKLRHQAELASAGEAEARKRTETNAVEVKNLLRRTYLANANAQAERGDLTGSLPWLVEALKLAEGNRKLEEALRINFGIIARQLPMLDHAAPLEISERGTQIGPGFDYVFHNAEGPFSTYNSLSLSPNCLLLGIVGSPDAHQRPGQGKPARAGASCIVVCDAVTGKQRLEPLMLKGLCNTVQFSPDNRMILGSAYEGVYVWDVATGGLIAQVADGSNNGIISADFCNDGGHLLLASYHRAIVWDLNTHAETSSINFAFKKDPEGAREYDKNSQRREAERYRKEAESGDEEALNSLAWLLATSSVAEVRDGQAAVGFAEKAVEKSNRQDADQLNTLAAAYAEVGAYGKAVETQKGAIELVKKDPRKAGFDSRLQLYESNHPYHEPELTEELEPPSAMVAHWSLDGRLVYYSGDGLHSGEHYLVDVNSGRVLELPLEHSVMGRVKFSPNGNLLVCFGNNPRAVTIVDTKTGKPIQTPSDFPGSSMLDGSGWLASAIFSPDSSKLILLGSDSSPQVWDSGSWRPSTPPLKHSTPPSRVVFSPDGRRIATATATGLLQLWDSTNGQSFNMPMEPPRVETEIGRTWFSPLARDSLDLRFGPDGQFIVFANREGAWTWKAAGATARFQNQTNEITSIEVTPDGTYILAIAGPGKTLAGLGVASLLSVLTGETQWSMTVERYTLTHGGITGAKQWNRYDDAVTLSANGGKVLTASCVDDARFGQHVTRSDALALSLWNAADGKVIGTNILVEFPKFSQRHDVDFRMEYSYTFTKNPGFRGSSSSGLGITHIEEDARMILPLVFKMSRNEETGRPFAVVRQNRPMFRAGLLSNSSPGSKATTQSNAQPFRKSSDAFNISDSLVPPAYTALNDDESLLILGRADNSIRVYFTTNGGAVGPVVKQTDRLAGAWFTPNGRTVAALLANGTLSLVDFASGSVLREVPSFNEPGGSQGFFEYAEVAFSSDGHYLVSRSRLSGILETFDGRNNAGTSNSYTLRIYSAEDLREIFLPPRQAMLGYGNNKSVGWGPSSRETRSNFAKVFDTKTRKALTPPLNHNASVGVVRLSPNEQFVATGSEDKTARVWDAETGEPITPPLRHDASVTALAFSADSRTLFTGTSDGSLRVWTLIPEEGTVTDLETLSGLYAGRQADQNGGLVSIPPGKMSSILRLWKANHASRVAPAAVESKAGRLSNEH